MSFIIAGTGHRPDKLFEHGYEDYNDWGLARLVALARAALGRYGEGCTRVLSGGALGWDTAIALAALKAQLPLTVAIPFVGQEKRWSESQQILYRDILSCADQVVDVSCGKGFSRKAMQDRNKYLCKHSQLLLALHDGSSGGTANCLGFAKEIPSLKVVNLWSSWLKGRGGV